MEEENGSILSQEAIQKLILPVLELEGTRYKKQKTILARTAKAGEKIVTITSDGIETANTAKAGDFIIQNQTVAKEEYIIGGEKFKQRYEFLRKYSGEYSEYKPKGKVIAIEMTTGRLSKLGFDDVFYFIAPWKEKMVVKKNDFLVHQPDSSEVYRIARVEFFETYQIDK